MVVDLTKLSIKIHTKEARMICERCENKEALAGLKFCNSCKKEVLRELREAGYLTAIPRYPPFRSAGDKEDTHATKFGIDR